MPCFTRIECQPPVKKKVQRKKQKQKTNIAGFILPIIVLISLCLEDVDC